MQNRIFVLSTTAALWLGTAALADAFTDAIIEDLQNAGYDYIEIQDGPTQVKVEAVKGDTKIEVVYDRSTGKILSREFETAETEYLGRSGIDVDEDDDDFHGDDGRDDNEHDEDHRDDEDDDHGDDHHDDDEDDAGDESDDD